jgi:branched-chain amino acid aminotransferase
MHAGRLSAADARSDAMHAIINVNGRITGERDAVISVLDHGFLYGEGIYEVVRTYDGRPFLFDRHLRRLRRSAAMIALRLPFTDTELAGRVQDTITAFHRQPQVPPGQDVYVRILVTRGVGEISYDPASCDAPSIVVIVKLFVPHPSEVYENGVKVSLVPIVRNHPSSISPLIKSNNLLNNALAAQEAFRRGAFDAVMRNYRGEISECSISNLFVVKDGTVLTPPLDAGLLAGITREFVLEIAPEAGVAVRESVLHDPDLLGADESFLTSSTQEIVPIVRADEALIGSGRPGPITVTLRNLYKRKIRELATWG